MDYSRQHFCEHILRSKLQQTWYVQHGLEQHLMWHVRLGGSGCQVQVCSGWAVVITPVSL